MTEQATNTTLARALQGAIKEYIEGDLVQSTNHCLRCSLDRAYAHMEAVQETTATILGLTRHSHRVGKAGEKEQP